jgi:hypothetical protein
MRLPYFSTSRRHYSLISLVLVSLSPLGLGGCAPLSMEKQCTLVYQASRPFEDYDREADQLFQKAIEKHVSLKRLDPNDSRSSDVKMAEVLSQLKTIKEKEVEINKELVTVQQKFTERLGKSAEITKKIRTNDKTVRDWQDSLINFYEIRSAYYRKIVSLNKLGKPDPKSSSDLTKQEDLIKEAGSLSKQIRDKPSAKYRRKAYEDFKRYCKIGPSVKIKSIGS